MKFAAASTALAALIAAASAAQDERTFAVLRFTNTALTRGRVDPIIYPNQVAPHVHSIMGGSNFNFGSTGEDLMKSNCSNSMIIGDNSNYWFPALYFHDPKTGEFESVDIFYVNAYYFFEATDDDIKPFPIGMSMVSGNAMLRTVPPGNVSMNMDPSQGPVQPIAWVCPRSSYVPPSYPPNSDGTMAGMVNPDNEGEGIGFPDMNCDGYASPLRADIQFPSCFNPAAGLYNYKTNMAWPISTSDGKQNCPEGYIHTPHLFIEVYWNTPLFSSRWTQDQGTQPFVLSEGDVTGYSSHADFMSGWDQDLLQHIIDTCNTGDGGMDTCAGLTYGVNHDSCTIPSLVDEVTTGTMSKLPGDNPLQGWQYGTALMGQMPTGAPAGSSAPAAAKTSAGSKPKSKPTTASTQPETTEAAAATSAAQETAPASKQAASSDCSVKVKTVVKTVTVTGPAGAQPTGEASNSTMTAGGFKYAGCFKDDTARALSGDELPNLGAVDNENCVTYCKKEGYTLAGTEYGGQCYCGNELDGSSKLDESECSMACEGDASSMCGGSWALSVYSEDGEASMKSTKMRRHAHDHLRHKRVQHF